MSKTVFVTVGTTRFDALLAVIDGETFQKALVKHLGAVKLVVQCGKSEFRPQSTSKSNVFGLSMRIR